MTRLVCAVSLPGLYDPVGNLVQKTDRHGRVIDYAYDPLRRKTTETWGDGRGLTFQYDATGRLVSASDPAATLTYTWDALGRVASEASMG